MKGISFNDSNRSNRSIRIVERVKAKKACTHFTSAMHNNYIGDVRVLHRACTIGTSPM